MKHSLGRLNNSSTIQFNPPKVAERSSPSLAAVFFSGEKQQKCSIKGLICPLLMLAMLVQNLGLCFKVIWKRFLDAPMTLNIKGFNLWQDTEWNNWRMQLRKFRSIKCSSFDTSATWSHVASSWLLWESHPIGGKYRDKIQGKLGRKTISWKMGSWNLQPPVACPVDKVRTSSSHSSFSWSENRDGTFWNMFREASKWSNQNLNYSDISQCQEAPLKRWVTAHESKEVVDGNLTWRAIIYTLCAWRREPRMCFNPKNRKKTKRYIRHGGTQ